MKQISSTANSRIKEIIKLQSSRERRKASQIIIEGSREIELALKANFNIFEIYYCPDLYQGVLPETTAEFIEVSQTVFTKIAYKENPEGILAIAEPKFLKLTDIKTTKNPLIIILENVEKPGNLGAILRTAYAAKIDAVIINDPQTDIYNPNVIRASMGHIFTVSTVIANTKETIAWLKDNDIKAYATAITAQKNYTEINYKKGAAIVMGTENSGLSKEWLAKADEQIIIPMQVGMDSLNVSVSTAIVIYEALRQKNFPNN
ncbi:MAG: RNA methyltransferase [Patescibacteria group bacterium]|nr:RNA methyltransferase [Patescibacteria group bacterium]